MKYRFEFYLDNLYQGGLWASSLEEAAEVILDAPLYIPERLERNLKKALRKSNAVEIHLTRGPAPNGQGVMYLPDVAFRYTDTPDCYMPEMHCFYSAKEDKNYQKGVVLR